MRITILLLIVGLCIVSAKYLPYENESRELIRNRRSNSEESNPSAESNNDSNNNKDEDDDDEDDNSEEQDFNKEKRKEVEQQRKLEEKLAKEQRKQEEKQEKEERKRLEKIEKEKRKEEEKHKKLSEKAEKEEKKRQEKQRKELEKLQNEALAPKSNEDSFLETEEESSVELGSIWRNYIYIKYGLTLASTNSEKKAALDKYLKEELGLNSNSTQSERHQAIIKLIETKLQNDTVSKEAIRNQLLNQINTVTINKLRNKLDHNIEKLNNKTNTVNNITLPWSTIVQKNLEDKKSFLQAISQFLSNVLPNWAPNTQNPNLNSTLEHNAQGNNNEIIISGGDNNKSGINEISADKNIISGKPSKLSPSGSSNAINVITQDSNSNINNVITGYDVILPQDLEASGISPNNDVISRQENQNVVVENKNSLDSSVGTNESFLKSGSSDVSPVSDTKLNSYDVQLEPANKDIVNATSVLDSNHNAIISNVLKVSQSSVTPSLNVDSSVTSRPLSNNENVSRISSVPLNSVQASATDAVANDVSITKDISAEPANKKISTNDIIQPSLSEYLSNNIQTSEDGIVANEESISSKNNGKSEISSIPNVSSVAPSINIDSSNSNGQLSDNENVSRISINDSNISSVNSSSDAYRDSSVISQSAGDIVEPSFSSVPLNSEQASAIGAAAKDVSLTKNISAEPPNKKISIIQPSLSESLSNNVQASEDGIVANQESISSKNNGKSEISSIPNVSSAAPSINIDSSNSNGQLSDNENVSRISINDSNISSVNSSSDAYRDSSIISQSAGDIVEPSFSSVPLNSEQASAIGAAAKDVSLTKNISADTANKKISIIQPSLSESLSNNVQASEDGIVANQENISSKTNGKSEISSISNVSNSSLNDKVNSSVNIKINSGVDMILDIIPAEEPVDLLLSNKSSVDVGVESVNSIASKIESSDNKIRINSNDSNINATNVVDAVSQNNNSVSSKLENTNNDIIANANESNISGSKINIKSSVNNGTVNVSSTVEKIPAHISGSRDIAILEIDISTSPSNIEPIYDNIGTTVSIIDIATNSPVYSNLSSSPSISVNVVSPNNKSENNAPVNEIESGNLSENSSFLGVRNENLEGNHTSTNDLANDGITNEINIKDPVPSLTINNNSSVGNTIDAITTDSSIGNEIKPKTNESDSNTIASNVPVLIADTLNPEVSAVITASADFNVVSTNSSSNISEIVKIPDNSSAVIGSENVLLLESNNSTSIQKMSNESALNGIASTEPSLGENTFITEAQSTLGETVNNVNTASSNLATESSLLDIGSTVQTDISQSLSTMLPADSSILAQVDGVTLPTEPGASVVEILPQV